MKTGKRYFLAVLCILCLVLSACGVTVIPSLAETAEYSGEELQALAEKTDEETLTAVWGQPQTAGNTRIWTVEYDGGSRYLAASMENGKILALALSHTLYVTVVSVQDNTAYGLVGFDGYTTDTETIAILPARDCFGSEIRYEAGDFFTFACDGVLMETWPAQMSAPYSAVLMGQLTAEETRQLAETVSLP